MTNVTKEYIKLIKEYINANYEKHMQEPIKGKIEYPYFTSGIDYVNQVWDWGSWLTSISTRSIKTNKLMECQKGIILNFLALQKDNGRIPIIFSSIPCDWDEKFKNCFKPVLAQHVLEISNKYNDFEWVKPIFNKIVKFHNYYENNQYDKESGLFYWADDFAIGVDNDPTTFYRQDNTSASILLNSLMYGEFIAMAELSKKIDNLEYEKIYIEKANKLKASISNECYDPIDGFFYTADISLKKIDNNQWLHSGHPRTWHSLPIKITTWAGMMPLYCGVATQEQANECVKRYMNPEGLYSDFGIRSLAKNEKMYSEIASCNPSCWLGPIWVNANYFTYVGLLKYGFKDLAKELAIKTINLLGKSLKEHGGFYEYYNSITGEGIRGLGMHGWNFLVLLMIDDIEKE